MKRCLFNLAAISFLALAITACFPKGRGDLAAQAKTSESSAQPRKSESHPPPSLGPTVSQSSPQSPNFKATVEANPTYVALFEITEQTSDGKLLFSIEEANEVCQKVTDPIPVIMSFLNLGDHALTLQSRFALSLDRFPGNGDLIPLLSSIEGTPLISPADFRVSDTFGIEPLTYRQLPPRSSFETIIAYYLPTQTATYGRAEMSDFSSTRAGRYILMFLYKNGYSSSSSTWTGSITSNQIEICVID
jgi:hypothetical protein